MGGCTHVAREAATNLSHAGMQASSTLSADVDARASRLRADRAAQDFVAAYAVMSRCPAVTYGMSADANCDAVSLAQARASNAVNREISKFAEVMAARSRALQALGAAYAALGDEAAYDAPGELDKAIGPALDAVNAFGTAVGLGPAPALAGEGVKLVGHALAASAQQRRLLRGSRQIALITGHMRLALVKERGLFGALDALLADLDHETRQTILKAGLLDEAGPAATVKAIALGTGLTISDAQLSAKLGSDQALRGAAEVAMLDTLTPVSSGDLDAGIALLADLEAQHAKFEHGSPLDLQQVSGDAQALKGLLAAAKQ